MVLTHTSGRGRCLPDRSVSTVSIRSSQSAWFRSWVLLAGLSPTLLDADSDAEHRGYTLFHPVPQNQLRPMSLDRPDKTESPYTVDAGHYQLEMDLVNYAHDQESGAGPRLTTDIFALAPMNWKVGLTPRVDLQVLVLPQVRIRESTPGGAAVTTSGFGDLATRVKINLWGNDDGSTAFAVMPYVILPTAGEGLGAPTVEGGWVLPFAAELPGGWNLGAMTGVTFGSGEPARDLDASFVNSITFGHALAGPVSFYIEFFSQVETADGEPWMGTADLGLTYAVTDNLQLDAGINFGVTRSAPDINPFLGLGCRF